MRRQRTTRPSRLTEARILKWMKVHFRRKGRWPNSRSGPVPGQPGETWGAIDVDLREGFRGLPGGSSLTRLLIKAKLRPPWGDRPRLKIEDILTWMEADHQETGKWPTRESGQVRAAPEHTWAKIHKYLERGSRGLPGGFTLASLVQFYRNVLLRAHWILPVRDGQRLITTPVQLTALLVSRGPLQQPDLLYSIRERQRRFQQEARGQGITSR